MASDRPFGPEALAAAVAAELATVPPDKRFAVVGYWTTSGHWRVSVVGRVDDHWQFGAVLERDVAAGRIQGGVQVQATW